ncbi:hypothetical protein B0H14DRAFT_2572780 [Mycena olivaceomarginata]|nr:hypothetical protein B0H14DRAFT_2572780 [Mycena olivaceomarginata]
MMGPGGRHAFLEGLFAFHNWARTVSYRRVFGQRMARDLKEARKHQEAFEAFTELIEGERPELVEKWKAWVKDWESEQHTDGHGSPFELSKPVHAMKDVRLRLGKDELTRTGEGVEIERQHTSSTFITMGLDIEESQRILTIDIKAVKDPSTSQELEFVKRKTALLKRINRFRRLQRTYMPDLAKFLTAAQREIWEDKKRSVETVKLFLPSELGAESRKKACEKGLDKIEEEMRDAELGDTLEELRQALRGRTATNRFRRPELDGAKSTDPGARRAASNHNPNPQGQASLSICAECHAETAGTRALGEGVSGACRGGWEIVEGGMAVAGTVAAGEGSHTMSWIWYSTKLEGSEEELVDDIVLVDEEMRRTIEYGAWMAAQWRMRAGARTVDSPALAEGLRAYAMEHVRREEETCRRLAKQWAGLREKAKDYLAGVKDVGVDVVIDIGAEEEDGEDEEGDVEGEEIVDPTAEEEDDEVEAEDV